MRKKSRGLDIPLVLLLTMKDELMKTEFIIKEKTSKKLIIEVDIMWFQEIMSS